MDGITNIVHALGRPVGAQPPPACDTGNGYDGRLGLRVAAIFIVWVTASFGAAFPVFAHRSKGLRVPDWVFFVCKYFGSGVIVSTAFIHLLRPAEDALRNPCLTGPITQYSWVEGIVLMTIFVLFFVELMITRYGNFGEGHDHDGEHSQPDANDSDQSSADAEMTEDPDKSISKDPPGRTYRSQSVHAPGEDHMGHSREHNEIDEAASPFSFEDYRAQMTAIFILEFGIIFHSVFIGLTLAVSGKEFDTLFIVVIFHQTFEGLGLGSRLAESPWPRNKQWTPYALAFGYGISTPIAIAIGLAVRNSYPPGSQTTLIINGVFDSISAGILIYTGLVELMAHEFMFSSAMKKANTKTVLTAFLLMCLGAAMMALLGKWA